MSEPICSINMQPEVLSAWRSRLLSADESARISAHIPDCSACQAVLARFDRIAEAVRMSPHMPSGEEIWRKMQQRMTQPFLRPPQQRQLFFAGGLGAAALVILIVALVLALPAKGRPTTTLSQPTVSPIATTNATAATTETVSVTDTPAATKVATATTIPNRPYVYFNTAGKILAINPVNHQIVWQQNGNHGGGYSQPFVVNGSVYAAIYTTTPHQGYFFSFNAQTGAVRWQTLITGNYTLFAAENGVLFAQAAGSSSIAAIRMSDGHILWTYSIPIAASSNLVFGEQDGIVGYFGLGNQNGQVVAVDAKTGTQKWSVPIDTTNYAPGNPGLTVGDGAVYMYDMAGNVRAFAGSDGHQLWSAKIPSSIQVSGWLSYGDGVVFAATPNNTFVAYDAQTGAKKWSVPTNGANAGLAIVVNGVAYVAGGNIYYGSYGNGPGEGVYAINVATGTVLWQQGAGNPFIGLPVVSGGWLYASVGSVSGLIEAFDINTGALAETYSDGFGLLGVEP